MLHLRVVSPVDRTGAVVDLLRRSEATINLATLPGVSHDPPGDIVLCDVAREAVNDLVAALRELSVHRDGSITLEAIELSFSDAAAEAERRAPGYGSDAAVWESVEARVRDDSVLTAGFLVFLSVAAVIAAIGLIEDSAILIVGSMVVGPEYGPIAGLAVGVYKRRWRRIRPALVTLGIGFAAAIAASALATLVADAAGLVPAGLSPHDQTLTGFIVDPSWLGVAVAFLAGITGTLALTQAKAGALIGVLISVTTIPAAAAIGLSMALGEWGDAGNAALQLAVNVVALIAAGTLTIAVQHALWERVARRG